MVSQDFFAPGDDGIHHVVVFGNLSAVVEVSKPGERLVGAVEVVGLIESVELFESVPGRLEQGVGVEQCLDVGFVSVGQVVGSA